MPATPPQNSYYNANQGYNTGKSIFSKVWRRCTSRITHQYIQHCCRLSGAESTSIRSISFCTMQVDQGRADLQPPHRKPKILCPSLMKVKESVSEKGV